MSENLQDREDAIGFEGNQDGTDPPSVEERLTVLENQVNNLHAMVGQILNAVVPTRHSPGIDDGIAGPNQ